MDGEGKETTTEEHSVNGTSVKIGCSLLCHIALKGLRDVHCTIDLNEHQQVLVQAPYIAGAFCCDTLPDSRSK